MAVAVETEPGFQVSTPTALFSFPDFLQGIHSHYWDVDTDGQRFLLLRAGTTTLPGGAAPEIVLVLNWFEELERLVPLQQ